MGGSFQFDWKPQNLKQHGNQQGDVGDASDKPITGATLTFYTCSLAETPSILLIKKKTEI